MSGDPETHWRGDTGSRVRDGRRGEGGVGKEWGREAKENKGTEGRSRGREGGEERGREVAEIE